MVIAIIGILSSIGIWRLNLVAETTSRTGYADQLGAAFQQVASRANSTNRPYALVFDTAGYRWGELPSGTTLTNCQTAQPTLSNPRASEALPKNTSTQPASGWVCVAAPGLISRLNNLPTCASGTVTAPCIQVRKGTGTQAAVARTILVSASGQVKVQ